MFFKSGLIFFFQQKTQSNIGMLTQNDTQYEKHTRTHIHLIPCSKQNSLSAEHQNERKRVNQSMEKRDLQAFVSSKKHTHRVVLRRCYECMFSKTPAPTSNQMREKIESIFLF